MKVTFLARQIFCTCGNYVIGIIKIGFKYLEMINLLEKSSSSSKRNSNTLDQTPQSLGVNLQERTPIGELVKLI
jgi:hypothetical protein